MNCGSCVKPSRKFSVIFRFEIIVQNAITHLYLITAPNCFFFMPGVWSRYIETILLGFLSSSSRPSFASPPPPVWNGAVLLATSLTWTRDRNTLISHSAQSTFIYSCITIPAEQTQPICAYIMAVGPGITGKEEAWWESENTHLSSALRLPSPMPLVGRACLIFAEATSRLKY